MLNQLVASELLGVGGGIAELRQAVDHVGHQVKAVEIVQHDHVERGRRGALLPVAADMEIFVVAAADSRDARR